MFICPACLPCHGIGRHTSQCGSRLPGEPPQRWSDRRNHDSVLPRRDLSNAEKGGGSRDGVSDHCGQSGLAAARLALCARLDRPCARGRDERRCRAEPQSVRHVPDALERGRSGFAPADRGEARCGWSRSAVGIFAVRRGHKAPAAVAGCSHRLTGAYFRLGRIIVV
jgi:hypothetical protein